ncbi:hypothetical protein [Pontibacter sp. BAB1700]|nr:hypothetical protein [Pontibacter sp. BAB1700]
MLPLLSPQVEDTDVLAKLVGTLVFTFTVVVTVQSFPSLAVTI